MASRLRPSWVGSSIARDIGLGFVLTMFLPNNAVVCFILTMVGPIRTLSDLRRIEVLPFQLRLGRAPRAR